MVLFISFISINSVIEIFQFSITLRNKRKRMRPEQESAPFRKVPKMLSASKRKVTPLVSEFSYLFSKKLNIEF